MRRYGEKMEETCGREDSTLATKKVPLYGYPDRGITKYGCSCCYPIFDPCFDKFSEKSKNSEKTLKIRKIHFLYICIVFSIF
jgi:hypothetical protein